MGEVWLATHAETGVKGALKVLKAVKDPAALARFRREMQALGKLRHHAIVKLIDNDLSDSKRPWLVMEHIEGDSLEKVIERGPMHPPTCMRAFGALADGLSQAHAYGIHHRDVKSNNVIVQQNGTFVLVDFGAAIEDDSSQVTHAGLLLGTTRYLAPEVVCGDERDNVSADIYALGMLAYEALTGKHAFRGPNDEILRFHQILSQKMKVEFLDPGPEFPEEIRRVVRLTTHKDPDKRLNRMDDFADMCEVASGAGGRTPMMSLRHSERLTKLSNAPATPAANGRRRKRSRPPEAVSETSATQPLDSYLQAPVQLDSEPPSIADGPTQLKTPRVQAPSLPPDPDNAPMRPPPEPTPERRGVDWLIVGVVLFLVFGLMSGAAVLGAGVAVAVMTL